MKDRRLFFNIYLQRFSQAFEKTLEGFDTEERLHIADILAAIAKTYRQKPVDYVQANALYESLLKKYGQRLKAYSNARLTDYFAHESFHHLDLQYELKVENAGYADNFFTEEELNHFLDRVQVLLSVHKQQYYLLADIQEKEKSENNHVLNGADEKNKEFTARRRALAMHYLNKHFKLSVSGDKAPLAEFTRFLTGNSYDKLYQVLRNPLGKEDSKKAQKNLISDLEYIKTYFAKLGLKEVVNLIDRDIKSF